MHHSGDKGVVGLDDVGRPEGVNGRGFSAVEDVVFDDDVVNPQHPFEPVLKRLDL